MATARHWRNWWPPRSRAATSSGRRSRPAARAAPAAWPTCSRRAWRRRAKARLSRPRRPATRPTAGASAGPSARQVPDNFRNGSSQYSVPRVATGSHGSPRGPTDRHGVPRIATGPTRLTTGPTRLTTRGQLMEERTLGQGMNVTELGLGCMGMSQSYGAGDDEESVATIHRALDLDRKSVV